MKNLLTIICETSIIMKNITQFKYDLLYSPKGYGTKTAEDYDSKIRSVIRVMSSPAIGLVSKLRIHSAKIFLNAVR